MMRRRFPHQHKAHKPLLQVLFDKHTLPQQTLLKGFSITELMVVLAILGTLAALAIPNFLEAKHRAKVGVAIVEIRILEDEILTYQITRGSLPDSLKDIGRENFMDPWGTPYQYLNYSNIKGKGEMRKDRFMVPVNTDFDLYSMGKDRQSRPPFTADASQDDIVRANDGAYIGLVSEY